jgi:hypothetical protein
LNWPPTLKKFNNALVLVKLMPPELLNNQLVPWLSRIYVSSRRWVQIVVESASF